MRILRLLRKHLVERMTRIVCLIWILFTIPISCSEEGDDFQSFLEKNDGTEWILFNDDITVYIRLNNNKTNLIEQWSYNKESDCYDYNPNIFIPGDFNIKENSIDILIIRGDIILSDYDYMTFSREDDTLTVKITLCEWQEETVYFNKSLVRLDDLLRCDQIQ